MKRYPRDMSGYGPTPPAAHWPGGAKIAVQLVLNYEEGGENNVLHGDAASEAFLSEIVGAAAWPGQRHWNMESMYEYGARAGFGGCIACSKTCPSLFTAWPPPWPAHQSKWLQ